MMKQAIAIGFGALLPLATSAGTLDHIRETGTLTLGYVSNGQPFSYAKDGTAAGFAVELCKKVAEKVKAYADLSSATIQWTAVSGDGLEAVQQGTVDLLCAASPVSLGARSKVSFSAPIFPGGISAVMHADGSERLKTLLEERPAPYQPVWRGTPPPSIEHRTFAAVKGSDAETWLDGRIKTYRLQSTIAPVDSADAGVAAVVSGDADVFFADSASVLEAVSRNANAAQVKVLSRHFEFRSLAFALPRNDDDFRLAVDRALTEVYVNPEFGDLYTASFGKPDADTVTFFRATAVPR